MKFTRPEEIRRLGIFFFYDKDGIVDDYVPHLLEDVKKNVSELLIVCNWKLDPGGEGEICQDNVPNTGPREQGI